MTQKTTEVKVINKSKYELPKYETEYAAGLDVKANIDLPIEIKPLERVIVPTGLFVEIPVGHEIQVRPRSGLAAKHGITVLNSPGTIDSDYRGEIKVILANMSNEPFTINPGERVAQLVLAKVDHLMWDDGVVVLSETERGEGGIGHTGR